MSRRLRQRIAQRRERKADARVLAAIMLSPGIVEEIRRTMRRFADYAWGPPLDLTAFPDLLPRRYAWPPEPTA